jgi:hypothetical protein
MRLEPNPEIDFDETSKRWYNENGRHGETCLQGAEIRFTKQGMKLNSSN